MKKGDPSRSASGSRSWDHEVDVVVVGYGGAGAVAAISAHDGGARVLILEGMPGGGGNTLVSFGGFLCPTNVPDAITYLSGLYELSHSDKDEEAVRVFAEEAVRNVEWVKGLREGTEVQVYGGAGFPQVPGAESMKKYIVKGEGKGANVFARKLWDLLSHAVESQRGIPVMTNTRARRLVTGTAGEVRGVVAEQDGKEISIFARKAVILTTGGYEFDAGLLQNSVKGFPIYSLGSPGNRGDGIRMAQKAGAGLWHMNGVSCTFGIKVPEFPSALGMTLRPAGHIFVDRNGRRFVNERDIETHAALLAVDHYDAHALMYPRIPFYAVFDEEGRRQGPISVSATLGAAGGQYAWSQDNSAEIEKGWIVKGETLTELAGRLNIDATALTETVAGWNRDVRAGEDALFDRNVTAESASLRIETAPFYAVAIYPCLINTQGGPRRNGRAQILDALGDPIPRLYSAGELGSIWGLIYQGGGNIAECQVFGRIAGRNAAAEKPWA